MGSRGGEFMGEVYIPTGVFPSDQQERARSPVAGAAALRERASLSLYVTVCCVKVSQYPATETRAGESREWRDWDLELFPPRSNREGWGLYL
jgi:hypothetical protein